MRFSPRGRVDWSNWARRFVPSGRWGNLPCHFTEPDSDPVLMAAVRWTLDRLDEELGLFDEAFAARLLRARVAEMRARVGEGETRRPAPEPMRGEGRLVWIDAKYKAHLHLVAQKGWSGLDESMREAHRADLHQALAYASLGDVEHVDSVLVYPDIGGTSTGPAIATVAAGRRRVRLILAGLPFGFRSPRHREETLASWRDLLAA